MIGAEFVVLIWNSTINSAVKHVEIFLIIILTVCIFSNNRVHEKIMPTP